MLLFHFPLSDISFLRFYTFNPSPDSCRVCSLLLLSFKSIHRYLIKPDRIVISALRFLQLCCFTNVLIHYYSPEKYHTKVEQQTTLCHISFYPYYIRILSQSGISEHIATISPFPRMYPIFWPDNCSDIYTVVEEWYDLTGIGKWSVDVVHFMLHFSRVIIDKSYWKGTLYQIY